MDVTAREKKMREREVSHEIVQYYGSGIGSIRWRGGRSFISPPSPYTLGPISQIIENNRRPLRGSLKGRGEIGGAHYEGSPGIDSSQCCCLSAAALVLLLLPSLHNGKQWQITIFSLSLSRSSLMPSYSTLYGSPLRSTSFYT